MYRPLKDSPSTWVKYRPGLCNNCEAACCTMPVEMQWNDILRLEWANVDDDPRLTARRLLKEKKIERYRDATGIFTMARKTGGVCIFLDAHRRCQIYDARPDTCRNFPKVSSRPGFCPAHPKK